MKKLVSSLLATGFIVACQSATQPAAEVPDEGQASAEPAEGAAESWSEELSLDQKVEFMKTRVVPPMAQVFGEHEEGEEVSCATCHGPDNKNPKEFLPALKFADGNITAFAEQPEEAQFMAEKVVPAMAKALGVEPYNVETGKGFGCSGCHAIQ